jgi:hypothetical protein
MTKYVENMAKTPAGDNLFNLRTGARLDTKRSEVFHTFVAKGLFLCKRARPNIPQAISVQSHCKEKSSYDSGTIFSVAK